MIYLFFYLLKQYTSPSGKPQHNQYFLSSLSDRFQTWVLLQGTFCLQDPERKNYVPKTSENDQGRSHQSCFLVCLCLFTSSRMRKRVNSSRSVAQTTYLSICPSQQKLLLSETNNAVSTLRAVCDASKYDS